MRFRHLVIVFGETVFQLPNDGLLSCVPGSHIGANPFFVRNWQLLSLKQRRRHFHNEPNSPSRNSTPRTSGYIPGALPIDLICSSQSLRGNYIPLVQILALLALNSYVIQF